MNEKEIPDGFVLSEEDLEDISQEELDDLKETVDDYIELVEFFDEELDDILNRINDSPVYEKMGCELNINIQYQYSIEDREE